MEQIESLSELTKQGEFELIDDVYVTDSYSSVLEFNGTLDGNGHTIYDLTSTLIHKLKKDAIVKNIHIQSPDLTVTKEQDTTGIFSQNFGSIVNVTVSDLSVTVTHIESDTINVVGGLVADNKGIIQDCSVQGSMKGDLTICGLIAGRSFKSEDNLGKISDTEAHGYISGVSNVGGIAGHIKNSTITNCSSSVHIKGQSQIGGISGSSAESTYENCTFDGHIEGIDILGGLVGSFGGENRNELQDCTVTGTVEGQNKVGGCIGTKVDTLILDNITFNGLLNIYGEKPTGCLLGNIWDDKISVQNCVVSGTVHAKEIAGAFAVNQDSQKELTDIQIKHTIVKPTIYSQEEHLTDTDHLNNPSNTISPTFNSTQKSETVTVSSEEELRNCSQNATIQLQDTITLTQNETVFTNFYGELHGNGHTITNLSTNLITYIRDSAVVSNVHITDSSIDSKNLLCGFVASVNNGTVTNVTVNQSCITGSDNSTIGGLIAVNSSTVHKNTITNVSISTPYSNSQAGLLSGKNDGTISNCTVDSSVVIGDNNTGSISGSSVSTIENCRVKQTLVQGTKSVGGLVGFLQTEQSSVRESKGRSVTVFGEKHVGGAFGKTSGTLTQITVEASVYAEKFAGGFAGQIFNSTVSYCTSSGYVTGSGFSGKILRSTITNSFTTQSIDCSGLHSKFSTSASGSEIKNCFSYVSLDSKNISGIGMHSKCTISDCHWYDTDDNYNLTELKTLCLL